ncbi:MAG: nitrite reductase small subunit NirD [Bryobacteraceae bacterium]
MNNRDWIKITPAENIPPREGRSVRIAGMNVALVNLGDRFVAVEDRCPHRGGPLSDGIVGGTTITCPMHNWRICLETGRVIKPTGVESAGCVTTFPVKVEYGIVMVAVDAAELQAA